MLANNVPAWFEIPAANLERAVRFYETVLGATLKREAMGPAVQMAVFPNEPPNATGCVMAAEGYKPSAAATTIYLNLKDDLARPLAKVEKAGGKVLLGKSALPDNVGYYAQFLDSEGNRVGFFSAQ